MQDLGWSAAVGGDLGSGVWGAAHKAPLLKNQRGLGGWGPEVPGS